MSIPITGVLLIPLGLVLATLPWRFCLAGLMSFAMMSPAAVVNVGNFGLQPGYYLGILLVARVGVQIMNDRFTLNAFVGARMQPLFSFIAVTLAVLFIALCFFQGQIETLPGSAGFKSGMTHPFHLARENFTQLAYLILNACLVYAMAHAAAREDPRKLLSACNAAIMCGLAFAVTVCVWQFVSLYSGLYFPSDFFYSNAGYSRADSQSMVGLFRINGPFEEPSTLGYNFSGYILYAWARHRVYPTAVTLLAITACIFCMLVSTSTTAFLGLFLFGAIAVFDLTARKGAVQPGKRHAFAYRTVAALIVLGICVGLLVVVDNWPAISLILNTTLFNKSSGTSFHERSYADYLAIQIFAKTYGIGIGLGSHKANSLLLTLLSNTGALGTLLFGIFAYARLRWQPNKDRPPVFRSGWIQPAKLGLYGLLMVHLISNPNLSALTLWLFMAMLLGLQACAHRQRATIQARATVPSPALALPPFSGGKREPSHASV